MIKETMTINPETGKLDKMLDKNTIIIPDGIPSPWDASGGAFPTTTPGASDRWIISVSGILPAPVGVVKPRDAIIYDGTTRSVIPSINYLITDANIIAEITDPTNWTGATYSGSIAGLLQNQYYFDGDYMYKFDGTTLFRIDVDPSLGVQSLSGDFVDNTDPANPAIKSQLITDVADIALITDPANRSGNTYTGFSGSMIQDQYYSDGTYIYIFDGTTVHRVKIDTVIGVSGNIVDNVDPANPAINQVQADWNEADPIELPFIKNKPTALSEFTNDEGFIDGSEVPTYETDPVFSAWLLGTPPLYSETDPVFNSWKTLTEQYLQRVDKGGMAYSKRTADIQSQSGGILQYTHGTLIDGDVIYCSMNLNANTFVVRFNDLNNLVDVAILPLTGYKNIFQMVKTGGYLYAAPLKGIRDGSASDILILKIEENLSSFSVWFDDGTIKTQRPVAMCTDDEFIYVATSRGAPTASQVGKIKIATGALVANATWTANSDCHAMTCYKYSNRTEIYTGSTYKAVPQMGKFTANAGVDASLTLNGSVNLYANNDITDDMAYVNINDSGGYVYVASESTYLSTRIDTAAMTAEPFWLPASYGIWNYYGDLYATSINGEIIKFPQADIRNPEIYKSTLVLPNELFVSSTGKIFITEYGAATKLSEITLNKNTDYTTNSASYSLKMGYENVIKYPFGVAIGRLASSQGYMAQAFGHGVIEYADYTTNFWNTLRVWNNAIPIYANTVLPIADGGIVRICFQNMTGGNLTISPVARNRINGGALGAGIIMAAGATLEFNKSSTTNRNSSTMTTIDHVVRGVRIGTGAPINTLDIPGSLGVNIEAKTASFTFNPTSCVINASGVGITGTLPAANICKGRVYIIQNNGAAAITIARAGADVIGNGLTSYSLVPGDSLMLISDGTSRRITVGNPKNVLTGTGDPTGSILPQYLGQEYFDTAGLAWYKSTGVALTSWTQLVTAP